MAHMSKEPFEVAAWPLVAMAAQVGRRHAGSPPQGGCGRSTGPKVPTPTLRPSLPPPNPAMQIANHFLGWLDPVLLGYSVNAGGPPPLLILLLLHPACTATCAQSCQRLWW